MYFFDANPEASGNSVHTVVKDIEASMLGVPGQDDCVVGKDHCHRTVMGSCKRPASFNGTSRNSAGTRLLLVGMSGELTDLQIPP